MHNHKDLRTLLLCALYAFVLLFFLSPDSYLRDIFYRCDSAWFFMCGKAWMNGLTPYVDFSDSKGPLLWLIYGVGYLISHHSYIGVFWISVVFYTATLFIAYKLCRLFLEPRPSALCVAILPAVMFLNRYHGEVRAEDFCYPFIMFSLYGLCRVIRQEEITKRSIFLVGGGIGISFTACLLMKWNIAAMIGGPMLCMFILSFKQKVWGVCLVSMVAGAVILALPFLIYFLAFADLGAMIDEYFVNTFLTMHGRRNIMAGGANSADVLTVILLIGLLVFCYKRWRYAWLIFCFLVFRAGMGNFKAGYYLAVIFPFFVFFLLAVVGYVHDKYPQLLHRLTPACCLLAVIIVVAYNGRQIPSDVCLSEQGRENYYRMAYIMAQVEKPKVMTIDPDGGFGTPVDALPAIRYWSYQLGATEEMVAERYLAIEEQIPDFIIVWHPYATDLERVKAEIETSGSYVLYYANQTLYGHPALYGRPGLKLPPEDFHVSQWDVWLKRNIFGI